MKQFINSLIRMTNANSKAELVYILRKLSGLAS